MGGMGGMMGGMDTMMGDMDGMMGGAGGMGAGSSLGSLFAQFVSFLGQITAQLFALLTSGPVLGFLAGPVLILALVALLKVILTRRPRVVQFRSERSSGE